MAVAASGATRPGVPTVTKNYYCTWNSANGDSFATTDSTARIFPNDPAKDTAKCSFHYSKGTYKDVPYQETGTCYFGNITFANVSFKAGKTDATLYCSDGSGQPS